MTKVITYGTYDLLHYGHIRLLERAKALGDWLIVGVTSDDFDKSRGKINVQQPLMERIEALRQTGIADEIIVEEYEGQKIDDIKRFGVDIFTVGSDWAGKFDYLSDYCKVVYLPRTEGVSSSEVRAEQRKIRIGFIGDYETRILTKYYHECSYVNGIDIAGVCARSDRIRKLLGAPDLYVTKDYSDLLTRCDAVYILSNPLEHYRHAREALEAGVHVLCEAPITFAQAALGAELEIPTIDGKVKYTIPEGTQSGTTFRLKGKGGNIVSVDATCTSIQEIDDLDHAWNSICSWGPTALLPIFQILGTEYDDIRIVSRMAEKNYDQFTKISFDYPHAVASLKVGRGIKSEGELVISGTKGYIYVPSPWWKTDYFEIRYENPEENKRYFYQLDGEGIRYELVDFVKTINTGKHSAYISDDVSEAITGVMKMFYTRKNMKLI